MIRIEEITVIAAPIQRCFDLSRSVEVHLLDNIHSGEQALATGGVTSGLTGLQNQVTWRARHFGLWQNLTNNVTAFTPPTYFQVTMTSGIFRSMQADHYFRTLPNGATELKDLFRIAAPLPLLGPIAEALFLRRYMLSLIRERNAVIKQLAESSGWQRYLPTINPTEPPPSMKIVIPGGAGQIGQILARHFHTQHHEVTILSRTTHPAPWRVVPWDGLTLGPWTSELNHADVVINLAGRTVNCRYTPANRRAILDSRVLSTQILGQAIASLEHPPAVWLNASTATIYRHALDRPMDETTGELGGNEPGAPDTWNFSIQVAKAWEEAFFAAPTPGIRKVALRSAMTFSPNRGGVFDVFLSLVRHGLGGTNLPGNQFVSWIHETDFLRAIDFLIAKPGLTGPINLASPHPLTNRDFLRVLRKTWGTPIGLPTTPWTLEIGTFLMRTESEMVLKSRQVVPGRLLDSGFRFTFPDWPTAARDLVDRWKTQK